MPSQISGDTGWCNEYMRAVFGLILAAVPVLQGSASQEPKPTQATLSDAAIARLNGDDKQIRMVAWACDVTNLLVIPFERSIAR